LAFNKKEKMKNRILAIIIGLLMPILSFSQENNKYSDLRKNAWSLYQSQEYYKSGQKYTEAFAILNKESEMSNKEMSDRFNASCAWSLAEEVDFAFTQLLKIAKEGNYSNYNQLISDDDLKFLYSDQRWNEVTEIVKANYEKVRPLTKEELNAVFENYIKADGGISTVADVDAFYDKFYTKDFKYNHPAYGGVYSRELLYSNTVKYIKSDTYKNESKRTILKKIVGLNTIVVERKYENSSETTMTLFKFKKNKIYYIEEYW
jgi:hypothetical protein